MDHIGAGVGTTLGSNSVGTMVDTDLGANSNIDLIGAGVGNSLGTDSDGGNMGAGVGTALGTKASRGHSPTPDMRSSKGAKLKISWNDPLVPKGVPSVPISPGGGI